MSGFSKPSPEAQSTMTHNKKLIALAAALVAMGMVVFGLPGMAVAQTNQTNETNQTMNQTMNQTANMTTNLTMGNQTSNGTAVMVNNTTLSEGGFVVLYNATMAESLGNSTYMESGTQENVNVTLNESLTENQTLIAHAFMDTNGNQQFDSGTDEVYIVEQRPVSAVAQVNVSDGGAMTPVPENATMNETATPEENETEGNDTGIF